MDYRAWIAALPGHPTQTEAGDAAGIDRSTVSRQLKRGALSMEVVAAMARAHGVKPADALVQTGHLLPEDIEGVGIEEALRRATNRQLFDEIESRADMEATAMFGKSIGVINPTPTAEVLDFPSNDRVPPRPADEEDDGTVHRWQDHPHAADSSPDEDALREEAGADPID
ncbi:helix-turn-helix domain-containing protein [Corynebacterium variabile]|uniref:helix-turn-helix domain-containing protein n=1 Tax=Corynebacterium variabile TaxID=1727 RepID=UPI0026484746|nr:helix-turn-helix transcriptional regulator [Corynebacterium variabile]MDN6242159.1 helix-turn-helix transcriptional regulator [Corynebacterium variabile]